MITEQVAITVFTQLRGGWTHNNKFFKHVRITTDGSYDAVTKEVERIVKRDFTTHEIVNVGWQYV